MSKNTHDQFKEALLDRENKGHFAEITFIGIKSAAVKNHKKKEENLEVLDFGGSLGSRFFSNYNFIKKNKIKWNIVEQNNFAQYGKNFLQNNLLFFYNDLTKCFSEKKINCVIFSGSLQYL